MRHWLLDALLILAEQDDLTSNHLEAELCRGIVFVGPDESGLRSTSRRRGRRVAVAVILVALSVFVGVMVASAVSAVSVFTPVGVVCASSLVCVVSAVNAVSMLGLLPSPPAASASPTCGLPPIAMSTR